MEELWLVGAVIINCVFRTCKMKLGGAVTSHSYILTAMF